MEESDSIMHVTQGLGAAWLPNIRGCASITVYWPRYPFLIRRILQDGGKKYKNNFKLNVDIYSCSITDIELVNTDEDDDVNTDEDDDVNTAHLNECKSFMEILLSVSEKETNYEKHDPHNPNRRTPKTSQKNGHQYSLFFKSYKEIKYILNHWYKQIYSIQSNSDLNELLKEFNERIRFEQDNTKMKLTIKNDGSDDHNMGYVYISNNDYYIDTLVFEYNKIYGKVKITGESFNKALRKIDHDDGKFDMDVEQLHFYFLYSIEKYIDDYLTKNNLEGIRFEKLGTTIIPIRRLDLINICSTEFNVDEHKMHNYFKTNREVINNFILKYNNFNAEPYNNWKISNSVHLK